MTWPSVTLPVAAFEPDEVAIGVSLLLLALGIVACISFLRRFERSIAETATKPSDAIGHFWFQVLVTTALILAIGIFVWTEYCRTNLFGKLLGLDAV
ncbi:MAG: hypothetical protein ACKOCB_03955 [Planctomycetia bacterium]